jgi:hypothetical protein
MICAERYLAILCSLNFFLPELLIAYFIFSDHIDPGDQARDELRDQWRIRLRRRLRNRPIGGCRAKVGRDTSWENSWALKNNQEILVA